MKRFVKCVLLFVFSCLLTGCDREYVVKERVLGYQGKARKNPYLAAEMYLQEGGLDANSKTGVVHMDRDESLIFAPASTVRSTGDAERVMEWVSQGGHFVLFLQRAEDYWQDVGVGADHDPGDWQDEFDEQLGIEKMMDRLELVLVGAPEYEERFSIDLGLDENDELISTYEGDTDDVRRGKVLPEAQLVTVDTGTAKFKLLLGGTQRVKPNMYGEYVSDWVDEADAHSFYSRVYGLGRVTIISDGRLFRNPYLGMEDHAAMLDYLAEESNSGKIIFSLGKVRSFISMLSEYAWMGMIGLLLLTALWLWKNLPNFGPKLDVVTGHFRSYEKQLLATGDFLWSHKQDEALLNPLRDEVRRRSGAFGNATISQDQLHETLSAASGLSLEDVQEAMTRQMVHDAGLMVRITQNLQTILKSL